MESFVILAEAARHGVRAVSVRAVSDAAETSLPYDFDRVRDARARFACGALLLELAAAAAAHSRRCCVWRAIAGWPPGTWPNFSTQYLDLLKRALDLSQSAMVAAI